MACLASSTRFTVKARRTFDLSTHLSFNENQHGTIETTHLPNKIVIVKTQTKDHLTRLFLLGGLE